MKYQLCAAMVSMIFFQPFAHAQTSKTAGPQAQKPSLIQQNTTSPTATPKRTQSLGNSQSSSTVQKPTGINKNAYQLDPTQKKPTGVAKAPQGANFTATKGAYLSTTNVYGPDMVKTSLSAFQHMDWVSIQNPNQIQQTIGRHGWRLVGSVMTPSVGGRGYVAYHQLMKRVVIAFRGTGSDIEEEFDHNKQVDKNIWLVPSTLLNTSKPVEIHKGFLNEYLKFQPEIKDRLDEFKNLNADYKNYEFFSIGFSLGSALATLAAPDIQTWLGPSKRVRVYAAGTPRVGDKAFRYHYEQRIPVHIRFTLVNDPVTKVPKERKVREYRHVGRLLPLHADGQVATIEEIKNDKLGGNIIRDFNTYHNRPAYKRALALHLINGGNQQAGSDYYPNGKLWEYANIERAN